MRKLDQLRFKYEQLHSLEAAYEYINELQRNGQDLYLRDFDIRILRNRQIEKLLWRFEPNQIHLDDREFRLFDAEYLLSNYELGYLLLGVGYKREGHNIKLAYYIEYDDEWKMDWGFDSHLAPQDIHEYGIIEVTITPGNLTKLYDICSFPDLKIKKSGVLKLDHCQYLEDTDSAFARQIYQDKKDNKYSMIYLQPSLRKYEWFVMELNGKIIPYYHLPNRPSRAIPIEGDHYYPWDNNGVCPHWHVNKKSNEVESLHFFGTKKAARKLLNNRGGAEFPIRLV